jgi:hypothetical protein
MEDHARAEFKIALDILRRTNKRGDDESEVRI